jgi:hypothetical protein
MSSTSDIRADIEATRAELAETADALAAKLDEKSQVAKRAAIAAAGTAGLLLAIVRVYRFRANRRAAQRGSKA